MKPVALACLVPLVAATKNIEGLSYAAAIPKENLEQGCEYPAYFTIENFATFTPSISNRTEVSFGYVNSETNITTSCSLNSTSPNIAVQGAAPRYACENSLVKFIWQKKILTVIEAACPTSFVPYDTSGSWLPDLACQDCTSGEGEECMANLPSYQGQFTSIEPVSSGGSGTVPTRLARLV